MKVSKEPHEYTTEEARQIFLKKVWDYVEYWDKESRADDARSKLEGLAFSMLVILDGGATDLPGFAVVPCPHESDKKFHEEEGEPWFRPCGEIEGDIAGSLHELFHDAGREKGHIQ